LSFGAFQTYYVEILPQSPSTISWIGGLQACLIFLVGAFSGRAFDARLFRPIVIVGTVIQLVGIFTMSISKKYWHLIVTQGICTGIGGGLFFTPVMGFDVYVLPEATRNGARTCHDWQFNRRSHLPGNCEAVAWESRIWLDCSCSRFPQSGYTVFCYRFYEAKVATKEVWTYR
jgi:hypothetical protein